MTIAPRAESHTLLAEEVRLRAHLRDDLGVRTRFAALPDVRALLVSPAARDGAKALVVASDATAAERIYLYVHVAAHIALEHHLPLVTIVEGPPGIARLETDARRHREAEDLARAMWWGRRGEGLAAPRLVRGSAVLRELVSRGITRAALRSLLLAMRAAYYDLRIERALARTRLAAWLRDALCVTAVVSAAPQLSD
ncbi:MAG TPA: hypothetical protein VFC31_09455 [Candidatus Limnocylindria bacterium]|nr:hypothetical protein [Candidatus Limnocylindria bacterium]